MTEHLSGHRPTERGVPKSELARVARQDRTNSSARNAGGDARAAMQRRAATVVLVTVVLGVSIFFLWSTQAASLATRSAVEASTLSDYYRQAERAVAAEELIEDNYHHVRGPQIRATHAAASAALVGALDLVKQNGDQSDREVALRLEAAHDSYLGSVGRMFDAIDSGDTLLATKIDSQDVDRKLAGIAQTVRTASQRHHEDSLAQLAELGELEDLTSRLTPWIFVLGLVLATWMAAILRGHRRLLETERRRALHESLHDALTGLPNRSLLFERCHEELAAAERDGTRIGLLLIDLDRFKDVNDTFGHHYGDELLRLVGSRLCSVLRGTHTIARVGGDEFAVLLTEVTDVGSAMDVGAKLRDALEMPFLINGVAIDVDASIGVVLSGEHGNDRTVLLQRADVAMYIAKAQNLGVFAYDPDMDGHTPAKLALLGELRLALTSDHIVLHYQPKVSLKSGEIVGVEALVRWQHPDRGLIFPDAFIPLAEHTSLIGPLTTHVLGTALAQARVWMDDGQPLIVSVNLSARSLLDDGLPRRVADLLAEHAVPARLLELEITESALMADPAQAQRLLEALAAMGVRLSIDDFGAGYTSLGQLKDLPVTEIKIDKSFIINMETEQSDALIARSIIDLSHSLGLTVLAEGVETAEALTYLSTFDCDIVQGYYICRPVPAVAFDTWRASRSAGTILSSGSLPRR